MRGTGEGVGAVLGEGAAEGVGTGLHAEVEGGAAEEVGVAEVVAGVFPAVEEEAPDVAVCGAVLGGSEEDVVPVFEVEDSPAEKGRAEDVFTGSGTDGIEAEGGEDVPGGGLPVVLVAAVAVGGGGVHAVEHFAEPVLGFPGGAGVVVEVYHVLDGLVAVGVVAHVHDGHFADFVDGEAVVAVVVERGHAEYGVEHGNEGFVAAHEADEPLGVVEDRPGVVPGVAFGEVAAPFEGREGGGKGAVRLFAAHEEGLRVEEATVVHCPAGKESDFVLRAAQCLREAVEAPIVVGVFEGAGCALVDANVAGDVAEGVVVFISQTPGGGDGGVDAVHGCHEPPPEGGGVGDANAFEPSIGKDGGGVVADHAVAMARACPFGIEAAFAIGVEEAFLHFEAHGGVEQVEEGEEAAEGVPDAGAGVVVTGADVARHGAVVHGVAGSVPFVEAVGEEEGAVEAGVEGAVLVEGAAFDFDAAEDAVPCLPAFADKGFQGVAAQFAQVALRLFPADEGGCHAGMYPLATARAEAHNGTRVEIPAFQQGVVEDKGLVASALAVTPPVGEEGVGGEGAVELDDEVVPEVIGHTAAVAGGVADDPVLAGDELDVGTAVESVHDDVSAVGLREGEAEEGGALRGRQLGEDVVVCEVDFIVVGMRFLALVGEPAGAFVLVGFGGADKGHEGELPEVVYPGAGLVGLFEATDFVGVVGVLPAVAHFAGLGRPEVHSPRTGDDGVGVAGGKFEGGLRAHQGVDVLHVVLRFRCAGEGKQQGCKKAFYFHGVICLIDFVPRGLRLCRHFQPDGGTVQDLGMGEAAFIMGLAACRHGTDVDAPVIRTGGEEGESLPVGEVQAHFGEEWGADFVGAAHGVEGIEAHGAEDVPGGHLTAILVAAQPGRGVGIKLAHHAADIVLGFGGLSRRIVKVGDVVARLVAVDVLPHHPRAENGEGSGIHGSREEAVEPGGEAATPAQQAHQPGDVVLHRPEVVPGVALADVGGVGFGAEIRLELPAAVTGLEKAGRRIVEIAVRLCTAQECRLNCRVAKVARQAGNAAVVKSIFQGFGERPVLSPFAGSHIERDVAQTPVVTDAAIGVVIRRSDASREGFPCVEVANAFQAGIGNDGSRMVANHHFGLAAPEAPEGKTPVLAAEDEHGLYHVVHAAGSEEGIEGMGGAVGVPERESAVIQPAGTMDFAVRPTVEAVHVAEKGRSEEGVVKGGVEADALVMRAAPHLDFAQLGIPTAAGSKAVAVEIVVGAFHRKVLGCPLGAHAGQGGAKDEAFALLHVEVETDDARRPVLPIKAGQWHRVDHRSQEGLGKAGAEVNALVARPTVREAVPLHGAGVGDADSGIQRGVPVHRLRQVEKDGNAPCRTGVTLDATTFGRRKFDINAVIAEAHAVVSGVGFLVGMVKTGMDAQCAQRLPPRRDHGQKGNVVEVACTGAGKVGVAEAGNGGVGVIVSGNAVPARASNIGAELHHAERHLRTGVGVAGEIRPDERVHKEAVIRCLRAATGKQQAQKNAKGKGVPLRVC